MSKISRVLALLAIATATATASAQNPPAGAPPTTPAGEGGTPPPGGAPRGRPPHPTGGARRGPRPYAQVITARAVTDRGGVTVHKVDDRFFFEVPDSLIGRDFLMVTRISGVPAGSGGFQSAGSSLNERLVRWERVNDRIMLRGIDVDAIADDSLPIAKSVAQNNYATVLAAFPIAAFSRDSNAYVVDVTDFFATDNPVTSGLNAAQRTAYGVRRFDAARSYVSSMRGFPINIEVRQVQTFDAARPPSDANGATLTMETRQSLV